MEAGNLPYSKAAQVCLLTEAPAHLPMETSWEVGSVPNSAEGMQAEGRTANGLHPECKGNGVGAGQWEEPKDWGISTQFTPTPNSCAKKHISWK